MITHFKYKPCLKSLASPLASLIMSHFLLSGKEAIFQQKENCFFVPVPLNPRKKRQRGFNQSELLAKELAKSLKIPCEFNVLVKIKKTKSQTELKRVERAENIKGSFAVSDKTKNGLTIQGKTIFLIDDVFTTGSTMEECARILKQANALSVWGITIAREPLDG